jgi:hypothetical protein
LLPQQSLPRFSRSTIEVDPFIDMIEGHLPYRLDAGVALIPASANVSDKVR